VARPRHPDAVKFLKASLFDDLDSFSTLEKRVSELPTPQDRGMAFEVFAEGYFSTSRQAQARHVWPSNAVPTAVKKKLGLPTPEIGYDGVIETLTGEYHAYQVKFRRSQSLIFDDIANVLAIGDKADRQVLITNCTRLPERALEGRDRFFGIRGNDLNRLSKADFEAIHGWLEGVEVPHEPKTPRPHQEEAITDILDGLKDNDRVTATMACGTGKTLMSLWVAEHKRLKAQNVLMLVPSLALLRQTLHEWVSETKWEDLAYLSVCSDPSVQRGVDRWVIRQSDLDFPVTTNSDDVRRFLSGRYGGTRLVFCTYQSAEVLAAGMPDRFKFDLGIFDEAHKTAGSVGKKNSFALSDENMKIKKRVFMTATTRHYHPKNKDVEGDHKLVYSMDNPKVYGPIVHDLTFAAAAKKDIICSYKVLISVAATDEVREALRERADVLVKGDPVKVRQVANQVTIQQAVEKHDVSKIISFHNTIAAAKSFTSDLPEGIGTHLTDFECFHVNGTIPTGTREGLMSEFRDSVKGIVSNASCLTEGVDVPVVDMVAFMAPKRSRIDIVQAVGRAMRKAPRKKRGYVLVPLYLEVSENESIEDALERTDFDEVGTVLNAMKTQDETLADVIREMRTERGRTGGFSDSKLRDYVEFIGPEISLPALCEGITTRLVDQLGATWDERYGELQAYRDEHGDCLVPGGWPENKRLANWVDNVRSGRITPVEDQRQKLDDLGFDWDPATTRWEQMYERLVAYKEEHGDCLVTTSKNKNLNHWVQGCRGRRSRLTEDQIARLDEIGFVWDVYTTRWEEMYEQLVAYKTEHGDCLVPQKQGSLGTWVSSLRTANTRVTEDQRRRLDKIGFDWDPGTTYWEQMCEELVAYKKVHGDCLVPSGGAENAELGTWVSMVRGGAIKVDEDRIEKLNQIGFVWDALAFRWERMYEQLFAYKTEHGDCLVPRSWSENPQLGIWAKTQRRNRSKLTEDRRQKLDDLGFDWDPEATRFELRCKELAAYKNEFGDCLVPREWQENPQLGTWVHKRRRRRSYLTEAEFQKLDEIGFVWDPPSAATTFELRCKELAAYKNEYGGCLVPGSWSENPELAGWVSRVRNGGTKTNRKQKQQLDAIGFDWDPEATTFELRCKELAAYKNEYGDCLIPRSWSENPELAGWVAGLRDKRRKFSEDEIRQLNNIGFVWDVAGHKFEQMYSALVAYKEVKGNCLVSRAWSENPQLGSWVHVLRGRKHNLPEEQIQKLDDIGFVWDVAAPKKAREEGQ